MKRKRLALGLVLFGIATIVARWERDLIVLFQDVRTRNASPAERVERMFGAYYFSDANGADVVESWGLPIEAVGYPGEVPTPGVQLHPIPSTQEAFEPWFAQMSRKYTRVAMVWPGTQGSDVGLEFRDGRRDSDVGLPPWYFAFLLALIPLLYTPDYVKRAISRRRVRAGRCGQCGYDLRGSAAVCPECGTEMFSAD